MTELTANYDETWKKAITEYFDSFLLFFYPDIHRVINWEKTPISLEKELEQITSSAETEKRHADKLYKVWLLDNQEIWLLIHVEIQSQYDKKFPLRMFVYNYRAFDLYNKPVISLAILGDESKSWRPSSYQYGMGKSQVKIEFNIVKLLDYKWEDLEGSENIFAVVVMAHLKTKATTSNLMERQQWKWNLVRPLYQRGLTKLDIINLVGFIDKMMTLPPPLQSNFNEKLNQYEKELDMPFLTTIEEMALERGAKQICQENIIDLLKARFNSCPESLEKAIKKIDNLAQLKELLLNIINVNSLTDFEQLINDNSSN